MSLYDDVDREALHDWLDERDALRADARPDSSEYEEEPETCQLCGGELGPVGCEYCGERE